MNSNDLFDELLSNKVEYDKNEVTVESVLEDLDIFDVDLTNLINLLSLLKENILF